MKIANKSIDTPGDSYYIHLDTLGIINGCIDLLTQELSYPHMAYNNTYGIQTINETLYQQAVDNFYRPQTGCKDLILYCQALAAEGDPLALGNNDTVNAACGDANVYCSNFVEAQYINSSGRNYYDIAAIDPDPFPPEYFLGYLAQHWVQSALGVVTNFTESTNGVYYAFQSTGDYARKDIRGGQLADIAYLLDNGVKVALMFGDRDYACNWIGGEEASLAVNYSETAAFHSAGYADVHVNETYVGGLVRQHGNFSFTRVFQSGHEIPAYQPETAYQLFNRAIFGLDMATGKVPISANPTNYSTEGPSNTWAIKNEVPDSPAPTCYILSLTSTCTDDQYESVLNGTALIHDYIVIDDNTTSLFPGYGNGSVSGGNLTAPGSGGGSIVSGTATSPGQTTEVTSGAAATLADWAMVFTIVGVVGAVVML